MIELLLLFIAVCVVGLLALAWLGAAIIYLAGKMVFGALSLVVMFILALGKSVILLVAAVLTLLAWLFSGAIAVAAVVATGVFCVWAVAALLIPKPHRSIVRTMPPPMSSSDMRMHRLMMRFAAAERRMRDLEARL